MVKVVMGSSNIPNFTGKIGFRMFPRTLFAVMLGFAAVAQAEVSRRSARFDDKQRDDLPRVV